MQNEKQKHVESDPAL